MQEVWAAVGGGAFGVLIALIGFLGVRRTAKVDSEKEFRDDLLERIDQQDRQLKQCEDGHRRTRSELDTNRRELHRALVQIDEQAGNIRRLEEQVAALNRQSAE